MLVHLRAVRARLRQFDVHLRHPIASPRPLLARTAPRRARHHRRYYTINISTPPGGQGAVGGAAAMGDDAARHSAVQLACAHAGFCPDVKPSASGVYYTAICQHPFLDPTTDSSWNTAASAALFACVPHTTRSPSHRCGLAYVGRAHTVWRVRTALAVASSSLTQSCRTQSFLFVCSFVCSLFFCSAAPRIVTESRPTAERAPPAAAARAASNATRSPATTSTA